MRQLTETEIEDLVWEGETPIGVSKEFGQVLQDIADKAVRPCQECATKDEYIYQLEAAIEKAQKGLADAVSI